VSGRFPQVSGVRFSYDPDLPEGDRILSAAIVDETSGTVIAQLVRAGELVGDPGQTFRIVTLNFLAGGGDGYPFPTGPGANRVDLYDLDADGADDSVFTGDATFAADGTEQDALAEYLETFFPADDNPTTPVYGETDQGRGLDERIQNLNVREDAVFPMPRGEVISGSRRRDELTGTDGDDIIDGGSGRDRIDGGPGDDRIIGGRGFDVLTGGEGIDIFVLASGFGRDRITDFEVGTDLMGLSGGLTFNDLSIGRGLFGSLIRSGFDLLAVVEGVSPGELSEADFILV
jgi:Ca2+-binding RTX toxin-like protein